MASVEKLGPGRWRLVVSLGRDPITGKYRKASKVVHVDGKREAQKLANAFELNIDDHQVDGGNTTLAALLDRYLEHRTKMSPSTRGDFETYIARSIPPALAAMPIRKISAYELDALYQHLEARGGVCQLRGDKKCTTKPCAHGGGGPLAASTVRRIHGILSAAFGLAVRWEWITRNPAAIAEPPIPADSEVELAPAEDLTKLLIHLDTLERDQPGAYRSRPGSPLPDFVALLLGSGARPGELCALRYGALSGSLLTVEESVARAKGGAIVKSTKTKKRRRLTLPLSAIEVIEQRRTVWREAALSAGIPIDEMVVFPSRARPDQPWRPDNIGREFRKVRDALGLDRRLTPYNLRHHVQSVLLAEGVDVVTVAKRGGHSPQVLLGVYAHMLQAPDVAAAAVLEQHITGLRQVPPAG